jgi:DNA-binding IclR family transcriptional regulator
MLRRQYQYMDESSGVGVLDKSVAVLSALEAGPASLASLVLLTGLPRPTAHRLAVALERHRLVARDSEGRFVLGARLAELAAAGGEDRLIAVSGPVLAKLRDATGESTQLYRRQGDVRVCVAAAELPAGSAAQVLLAWEDAERLHRGVAAAVFSAQTLARVRRQGWAASVAERQPGVASVSAPVRSAAGRVVAAVSVSGPIERLSRNPGRLHARAVVAAGEAISRALGRPGT